MSRTPGPKDRRLAWEVLDDLGIGHLADHSFASLSGGERALTLIARALVQEARILVLDEPTAALDLGNAVRVLGVVAEMSRRGHTVLMTTHQPDHALRGAHRAVLLCDGRVVANGKPAEVLTAATLSDVYGTPIQIASVVMPGRREPVLACVPEVGNLLATPREPAEPTHPHHPSS
ncbi:ABC transporter ATP-binding protein [Thermopolyspora sp. NPDC052614]|uniref:ABC transporter ATP-binding protein n=1 Tax=Thermopolyspora sp. NPDC052614 TaxID=3155682 RepID=UPI00342A6D6D